MVRRKAPQYGLNKINYLFNHLIYTYRLKNDAALCRVLEVQPAALSKVRHGANSLGDSWILSIHEVFEIPIAEIKEMLNE
jgi:hypothetical protein